MQMKLNFLTSSLKIGPIIPTRILNKDECNVAAVGTTFSGKLGYRNCGEGFLKTQISHVFILSSVYHKDIRPERALEVDLDIYTTDGRVIEIHTFEREVIKAAIELAPKKDIRARFRQERGR